MGRTTIQLPFCPRYNPPLTPPLINLLIGWPNSLPYNRNSYNAILYPCNCKLKTTFVISIVLCSFLCNLLHTIIYIELIITFLKKTNTEESHRFKFI